MIGNEIPVLFLILLAGIVGYLLLRRSDDGRSIRRNTERGDDKGIVVHIPSSNPLPFDPLTFPGP